MEILDRCPDCDTPVTWTKVADVRTAYEATGTATVLRWNATTQWHEPAVVPTYQVHQCPRREEAS